MQEADFMKLTGAHTGGWFTLCSFRHQRVHSVCSECLTKLFLPQLQVSLSVQSLLVAIGPRAHKDGTGAVLAVLFML